MKSEETIDIRLIKAVAALRRHTALRPSHLDIEARRKWCLSQDNLQLQVDILQGEIRQRWTVRK